MICVRSTVLIDGSNYQQISIEFLDKGVYIDGLDPFRGKSTFVTGHIC